MKRILLLSMITALSVMPAFADEDVLIDFTKLTPDLTLPGDNSTEPNQNKQTIMDFGITAGASYTSDQKKMMKTSLAIPQWEVNLAQSSRTVENIGNSYTKVANSKEFTNVMGVRIHFPVADFNSWAEIVQPFEIPAYNYDEVADDGTVSGPSGQKNFNLDKSRFEDGYGVVKNVGAVKGLTVQVYGLNFPCTLFLRFKDGSGKESEVNMGSLQFDGWSKLTWQNPQYIQDVRNRAIRLYPIYPVYAPYVRFTGFRIARDAADSSIVGGDLITYFKDVSITYDRAVLTLDRDIDDEATWDIINNREQTRQRIESKGLGRTEVLRYIEKQKEATEVYDVSTGTFVKPGETQASGGAAPAPAAATPAATPPAQEQQ